MLNSLVYLSNVCRASNYIATRISFSTARKYHIIYINRYMGNLHLVLDKNQVFHLDYLHFNNQHLFKLTRKGGIVNV